MLIKTDKEFCMIALRNPEKLKLTSVKHEFAAIMRDRHKDMNCVFSVLYKKQLENEAVIKLMQ